MKATLRYYKGHFIDDENVVFSVIAKNNVEIIKTIHCGLNPKVKIKINSLEQLNKIVQEINDRTTYGVSVVKVKKGIFRK